MATGRTATRSKNSLKNRSANPLSPSSETVREADGDQEEERMDPSIEEQLVQAKSSRTQAENARQKIANEILEATKTVCQKLIADGEQTLERAKKLEAEAVRKEQEAHEEREKGQTYRKEAEAYSERVKAETQKKAQEKLDHAQSVRSDAEAYRERVMAEVQQEAQEQLNQAQSVRADAETYRDRVISEAKEQGQEILYLSRSAAEHECNEMKHHADLNAQRTMAEAELVKAAAQEELEAQKIYAEAARLETESLEVLAQVRAKLADPTAFLGNSVDMASLTVQLNSAWESNESGEMPIPAVEPNPVKPKVVAQKASVTARRKRPISRAK
ncbi:MAG: hypothetical protein O2909_09415 [Chloroflexi bacterium]|nr:hypothetical protein [Chloroflexota bacterium]MDA1219644.1 hypothetical protein [Chloroflexota bacterium]